MEIPFIEIPFMEIPFMEIPFMEIPFIEIPLLAVTASSTTLVGVSAFDMQPARSTVGASKILRSSLMIPSILGSRSDRPRLRFM
ncbi:MAG TPA: hypothetical protein VGD37_26385 [Kofleriaceae bacterium]